MPPKSDEQYLNEEIDYTRAEINRWRKKREDAWEDATAEIDSLEKELAELLASKFQQR